VDDTTVAWDRWGDGSGGTPLFLCHGFSGSSHDFALAIEELAASCEVVAVDHRWHGRSQKLGTTG
jgi:pimeloyl-ACP methyl ester carboxylesterase